MKLKKHKFFAKVEGKTIFKLEDRAFCKKTRRTKLEEKKI
jgi:hypothetical protein